MRTPIVLIFLFGFGIIYDVEAYPTKHEPANNSVYGVQHCINMTPENEEKINTITAKISEYLYNLTIEHDVFDIRLLKIVIEGHSDDEVDEKDTQIQLVVNDCVQPTESDDPEERQETIVEEESNEDNETIEIDFADTDTEESEEETSAFDSEPSDDAANDTQDLEDQNSDTFDNNDEDVTVNNETSQSIEKSEQQDNSELDNAGVDIDDIQPSSTANYEAKGPVLVRLDLDKTGKKLIQGTQEKRGKHVPLILYIQKVLGNTEYLFAN